MKQALGIVLLMILNPCNVLADDASQWRGPGGSGVYPESGLLSQWPEGGPQLLWSNDGIGTGYSSASVYGDTIYVTGRNGDLDSLSALSLSGELKWSVPFGSAWDQSYGETRTTPTVEEGRAYVISGQGEVAAIDTSKGSIVWSVPAYERFKGEYGRWGVSESPLMVEDKVIYTVGGELTTVVALDKRNGETVWQSESLNDSTAYVSPILITVGGKKIIVGVTANYVLGLEAKNGDTLWTYEYTKIDPDESPGVGINANTPLFIDGMLFVTSGYNHIGAMFKVSEDGDAIEPLWTSRALDTHMGGVVHVDGYIYGANWINNRTGNWVSLNAKTGKTMYETEWMTKGSIISADGMLYCYEEKNGYLALAKATPEGFDVISSFQVTLGEGPHWSHPVIADGVLYMRHGDVLMAYDVREN
ncbi:MAG: PQQ-like beta-propeller repeat protein [bacterium]|nr:PQQ-like beta-propeller repeat protein [bacterium]